MDTIVLKTATSYQSLQSTLAFINAGFKATKAKIMYDVSHGLPPIDMEDSYPLVLEGFFKNYPTTIKVFGVTAGYNGEGPNTLISILEAAGFILDYQPILTKAWTHDYKINITCFPNGVMHDNISGTSIRHSSAF